MACLTLGKNIVKLEFFFVANDIKEEDRQKAVLLSGVGATTYSLLRSLISPQLQKDKTYEELTNVLKADFKPKPRSLP